MKSNSFLRNRKALTALLLCTGFVATQPFSVMAEEIVTAVQTVQQQKQSVSGTIKDPAGEPVIGASILEKGTTNGTITDFDGNFTLNVAPGATLVISYIGYKNQEMKVIPGKSLNIILQEDTETLEEVLYKKLRHSLLGWSVNIPTSAGRWISKQGYKIANNIIGFN